MIYISQKRLPITATTIRAENALVPHNIKNGNFMIFNISRAYHIEYDTLFCTHARVFVRIWAVFCLKKFYNQNLFKIISKNFRFTQHVRIFGE